MFGPVLSNRGCWHEFSKCSVNTIFHVNITSIGSFRSLKSQGRAVCHLGEQVRTKERLCRRAAKHLHLFSSTNINTSAALVYQPSRDRKGPTLIQAQLKEQLDASSVSQERKEKGFLFGPQKQGNTESVRRKVCVVCWSWGSKALMGLWGGCHSSLPTCNSELHILS